MKRSDLFRAGMLVAVCAVASKAAGLVRESVMAAFYGASGSMDVFLVAEFIPGMVGSLLISGLALAFIPVYSGFSARGEEHDAEDFFNNVTSILLLLVAVATILGMIFTDTLVFLIAPGFLAPAHELAVQLARLILPGLMLSVLFSVACALQHCHGRFLYPALAGILSNVVMIGLVGCFAAQYGIIVAAMANTLALAAQLVFQWSGIRECGRAWRLRLLPLHPATKEMARMFLPVVAGSACIQIAQLVERMLASELAPGSLSSLMYASRIQAAIGTLCVAPVLTVMFPALAQSAGGGNMARFESDFAFAVRGTGLVVLPLAAGIVLFGDPIIAILLERGAFDAAATAATAYALRFYAPGVIAYALAELCSRAFYASHDMKTPLLVAAVTAVFNIGLAFYLTGPFGHGGLALAYSLSMAAGALLSLAILRRRFACGDLHCAAIVREI